MVERGKRLRSIFLASGLSRHFAAGDLIEPAYDDFSKLKVARNNLGVLSFEIYTHIKKPETFRVHHALRAPTWLVHGLAQLPNARPSPKVGVNFDGAPLEAAKAIAAFLDSR